MQGAHELGHAFGLDVRGREREVRGRVRAAAAAADPGFLALLQRDHQPDVAVLTQFAVEEGGQVDLADEAVRGLRCGRAAAAVQRHQVAFEGEGLHPLHAVVGC